MLLVLASRYPISIVSHSAGSLLPSLYSKVWTFKASIPALAGCLSAHALSGATTYVTSTGSNPASASEGESFSFAFYTSGYKAFSYKVDGLPAGLSYNGDVNGPIISGTPSAAGSYEVLITGYRFADLGGNQTPAYSLSLNVGASSATSPWNDSNTQSLDAGWTRSSWFGDFYGKNQGWLYHLKHGWLYLQGTAESGFWIHDESLGWLYTGKSIYPFLYRNSNSSWLYDQSSSSERKFWDYASNQAITPAKK